jgi:hypothetical protein
MQPQPHEQQPKGVQKATAATERVAERAQSTFENAKERVREQLGAVSRAFTRATEQLDQDQQSALSRRVRQYVQKTDDASRYLQDKSPREMKDDLESLARQRPAWVLGGAFLLGLLGARFLKSSERRGMTSGGMKGAVGYGTA